MSFSENWICRDGPAVLLMMPNPLPRTMFEGNPKLTRLKTLKNSARNCSCPVRVAATSERRIFDERDVVVLKARPAKSAPAQRAEAALVRPGAAGHTDGDGEERGVIRAAAEIVFANGAAGGEIRLADQVRPVGAPAPAPVC